MIFVKIKAQGEILMHFHTKHEHIPNDFIAASRKWLSPVVSAHMHDFFEIEFVISGSGVCEVDGREYPFCRGSVFFLTPINTHTIKSVNAEIFNVMFCCESASDGAISFPIFTSKCPFIRSEGKDTEMIYLLLSELVEIYEQDVRYAGLLLTCLCKKLDRMATKECGEQVRTGYMQQALQLITERFKHKIALADIAERIGLTPSYFSCLFKKEMGVSFGAYLDNLRFSYAKNLLLFTDLPILDVAQEAGFNDYTNFERRFKKNFSLTPSRFRQRRTNKTDTL